MPSCPTAVTLTVTVFREHLREQTKVFFRERAEAMEVHFTPEVQAQLEQMARDTGRRSDELVENVVTDFFEDFVFTRGTLDRRYDDLDSGAIRPIPGDEVFARLRAKIAARRAGHRREGTNFIRKLKLILTLSGNLSPKTTSLPQTG
jgi:hypothetical protein